MKNRKKIIVPLLLVAAMVVSIGYAALSSTLAVNGSALLSQPPISGGGGTSSIVTPPEYNQFLVFFTQAGVTNTTATDGTGATLAAADVAKTGLGEEIDYENPILSGYYHAKAWFHITGLKRAGETVTFTYTIQNGTRDVDAVLKRIDIGIGTITGKDENGTDVTGSLNYEDYFDVTVSFTGSDSETFTGSTTGQTQNNGYITLDASSVAPALAQRQTATVTVKVTLKKTVGLLGESQLVWEDVLLGLAFESTN